MARTSRWWLAAVLACAALPVCAQQAGLPAFTSTPGPGGSQTYSLPIQTLLFLTALTFLPMSWPRDNCPAFARLPQPS